MELKTTYKNISEKIVIPMSIVVASLIVAGTIFFSGGAGRGEIDMQKAHIQKTTDASLLALEERIVPSEGVILPVVWGDLGVKLARAGVIDIDKFVPLYENRGTFTNEYRDLLSGQKSGQIKITRENAGYLLNLFWALGLAQKNPILETGEIASPAFGGAQNFASTGGWTMADGDPMTHYSHHVFFELTPEEQMLVSKVARGVYRPCCDNATHFPDCNHGMAMLGLLELMASQGVSEKEMWKAALAVNSYWFPDTYMTIATYMEDTGVAWTDTDPKELLGRNYSSASGYAKIAATTATPGTERVGSGCGVGITEPARAPRTQSGCGI